MKDFKKLIREAHLGNPLNEEDRATIVDKILSDKYEDEDYKDSERYADVRADLEREDQSKSSSLIGRMGDRSLREDDLEENEKWDKISKMKYGKPWMELSIAQKQKLLSYMNRDTEKEFERRMSMREEFSPTQQKMINQVKSYKERGSDMVNLPFKTREFYFKNKEEIDALINEALDPKDFPANFFYGDKIYVFDRIAGSDRAVYYNPKYKGDYLAFGSKKQMDDFLGDYVEPKGGTQSSHFGTNENINEGKFEVGDEIVYRGNLPGKVVHVFDYQSYINPSAEYKIKYISDSGNTTTARVRGKEIALKKDLDDMGRKYFGKDYDLDEGTCGYGEDGVLGEEPAGAHLQKEDINESVTPSTRVTYIASPAPRKMLAQELEDLFGDDYRNIVTEFQDDGGYESVLMFNLTDSDIERIEDEIGDVLIGEYSLKKVKDIQETLKEDMNDPVLVKARAAQMKRDKIEADEKDKKSYLDKKYGSSFMDKLDAEINLKQELQDLKDEKSQLMMDMEQEAEPEGGEIADLYGMKLNRIDLRTAEIKSELEDLRMYESVNEDESDLDEGNGGAKQDFTLNINNPGAESHALDDEVNKMGYSESLQESLRKKLQDRLK